jgi:hypothetical protein
MKKINKVNPLTHFNNLKAAAIKKAGGEMSAYKKSLKKAQTGIQTNGDSEDMMINKPGSTGGYKKPIKKYYPWESPIELERPVNERRPWMKPTREYADPKMDPNYNPNIPATSNFSGPQESKKGFPQGIPVIAKPYMEANGLSPEDFIPQALQERKVDIKQKTGGAVKRNKKC